VRNGRSVPFGFPGFGGILRQHPHRPGLLFTTRAWKSTGLPFWVELRASTHVF